MILSRFSSLACSTYSGGAQGEKMAQIIVFPHPKVLLVGSLGRKKMRCPFCRHEESKVTDSRTLSETDCCAQKTECLKCGSRFTTFETPDLTIQVLKRDGTFEDFQQEKLTRGLMLASCHSRISHDQVRSIVSQMIADLMDQGVKEISSQELGRLSCAI